MPEVISSGPDLRARLQVLEGEGRLKAEWWPRDTMNNGELLALSREDTKGSGPTRGNSSSLLRAPAPYPSCLVEAASLSPDTIRI